MSREISGRKLVELSYDIQSGLGNMDVPDFESMRTMGMAATLAIHLRGLPQIDYEVLRKVSDHYFSIPSFALKEVINVLAEIEYVQIIGSKAKIQAIIPNVPRFSDVYDGVGDYFSFNELNEHEQGTLLILSELQNKPVNRDALVSSIGLDSNLFKRCVDIGSHGHYFKEFRTREKNIIASPYYFADNLDGLANISAKIGSSDIEKVIEIVKKNQGWPLSLIERRLEMGGDTLTVTQKSLLLQMCSEGILKPPSIKFQNKNETFIFTPRPGGQKLNAENREIYERAMALVSCVRKGQLLADRYKIRMPLKILEALRDRGFLKSNSEAANQYKNLVFLKVGHLKHVEGDKYQFHINKTSENIAALNLAISLLKSGESTGLELNHEAQIALSKDEQYIQSIISSAELKKREKFSVDSEAAELFEQMILNYE